MEGKTALETGAVPHPLKGLGPQAAGGEDFLDQVVNDREEIVITRQGHESVVIASSNRNRVARGPSDG